MLKEHKNQRTKPCGPYKLNLTNKADGTNRRKSSQESVMTPRTVMSASPTNLPKVPASVARKPEFHVPLDGRFLGERVAGERRVLRGVHVVVAGTPQPPHRNRSHLTTLTSKPRTQQHDCKQKPGMIHTCTSLT